MPTTSKRRQVIYIDEHETISYRCRNSFVSNPTSRDVASHRTSLQVRYLNERIRCIVVTFRLRMFVVANSDASPQSQCSCASPVQGKGTCSL